MDGEIGRLAAELTRRLTDRHIIVAAQSEARASALAEAAWVMAPGRPVHHLPAWDAPVGGQPSRAVMGARLAALAAIAGPGPHLLIAPAETLVQRVPRVDPDDALVIRPGDALDLDAMPAALLRLGYAVEDRADGAGEAAIHTGMLDVHPAAARYPARVRLSEGLVAAIDLYDPVSQRRRRSVDSLRIGPAIEAAGPDDPSVFDLLPGYLLLLDPDSAEWVAQFLGQADGPAYLDEAAWRAASRGAEAMPEPAWSPLPDFGARDRVAAIRRFVAGQGVPVGISGHRLARAFGLDEAPVGWAELVARPPGSLALLPSGLEGGFACDAAVVVASADVFPRPRDPALFTVKLHPGDTVVHLDHGVAVLEGLDTVEAGVPEDCLILRFAAGQRRLVKHDEMDRIWRHGSGGKTSLDRLGATRFRDRRAAIEADIAETAGTLLAQAAERRATPAPVLRAPARRLARFAAGFPHVPSGDQTAIFAEIAADLARGFPMDRVVVGDVGFGKTEIALRAAAIAVLAGKQVAVLAPTTVLVRQHAGVFARRFRDLGVEVGVLSRLTRPAEARLVRERLASGELRVVVGTTALGGKDVAFAELGLAVIDEEQRFGTRDKAALARLRGGVHALTLTATPIPRTLEQALAGLRDISVLATPPARRQAVRTQLAAFDPVALRAALLHEHARGGQSFVVAPRIEDLAELAALLARIVPDLMVVTLHGQMKPEAIDAALVGFAEGRGDVLLATNIVEAGLDIPRANTMVVCDADHFGLAQLHQLRGRVGRGRVRGVAMLCTDPARPPGEEAAARLAAMAAHDGLGAGFAVSAADLDLRGGGDLTGEVQAGHAKLLGPELARHILARQLEGAPEPVSPELSLGIEARLPAETVPDEVARIDLYLRLARGGDLDALAEEFDDRFGPPPAPVAALFALTALRAECRRLGVAALEAGPEAAAARFADEVPQVAGLSRKEDRLLLAGDGRGRLELAQALLAAISGA